MEQVYREKLEMFPTNLDDILQRVDQIDPVIYGSTRNFIDGAVSYLSPYISRGVISTQYVLESLLKRGNNPAQIEKLIQELAWRDYWQQIWIEKDINSDIKSPQKDVINYEIPDAIVNGKTGIKAIDHSISLFYETGYLHNHLRMYIASIACNVAGSHWKHPAQWMYYHLLDADWASNALSWQWVAGSNSHKKYYANQDNINKYCHTNQKDTFLDIEYNSFSDMAVPTNLQEISKVSLKTQLPNSDAITIQKVLPTLIYNFYNLDPTWHQNKEVNRILLLEPSHFDKYPVSKKSIEFMLSLADNIPNIQVYVGEFSDLLVEFDIETIRYKEHPLNCHYEGCEESRDWMFSLNGYFPSFFSFWKKAKKELKY